MTQFSSACSHLNICSCFQEYTYVISCALYNVEGKTYLLKLVQFRSENDACLKLSL